VAGKRILIVKPSSLGDIAHALPVASALKHTWPKAEVAWLANGQYRELVECCPQVDRVYEVDREAWRGPLGVVRGTGPLLRLVCELRRARFDLVLDLQGLIRSALYSFVTGAAVRAGEAGARELAGLAYTRRAPTDRTGQHAIERYLAVARAAGADISAARAELAPRPDDARWFHRELTDRFGPHDRGPVITLVCGSRWSTKVWPTDHYIELAAGLQRELDARVVVIGAGEFRDAAARIVVGSGDRGLVEGGRMSLGRLVAIVAASDVVVGSDSGPQHVAHAAGTPTVTLYGPTAPGLTAPRGPSAGVVEGTCERAPCYERECEDVRCMSSIAPERVFEVVAGLAGSRTGKRQE
jgi:lipopolysaccharide heptosyltransferase I